ncbi:NAD-dependent epimerase/dehydratase family protein, partial [Candidatus Woesearchaeota archaeon]
MRVLVTGIAGFIGSHVAHALVARGDTVIGIDNFNDYYDVALKRDRVAALVGDACPVL